MAEMWIQGGHKHQTITKMLSDALFIGFSPNGATIRNEREMCVRNSIKVSTSCSMTGTAWLEQPYIVFDRFYQTVHPAA